MQKKNLVVLACVLAAACGGDDNNSNNAATNNGATNNTATNNTSNNGDTNNTSADMGGTEDIPTFGDVGGSDDSGDGCDEAAALRDGWPLNDAVASGSVDATDNAGTWTATLDAAAGGTANAASNPFVYLDLDGGAKVDVTDYAAGTTDTTWDIAFRRTAAFINGGDSGPGGLEIARLTGVTFDGVTSGDIPADSAFVTEDGIDESCQVVAPASGFGTVNSVFEQLNPDTTSGSWYNYSMGASGPSVTAYDDHVYIIRTTDQGKVYKFGFVSWESGVIEVQWAEL